MQMALKNVVIGATFSPHWPAANKNKAPGESCAALIGWMTHSWSVPSSAVRSGSYVPEQKKPRQFCAILYCAQHGPVFLLVALMLVAAATLAADY